MSYAVKKKLVSTSLILVNVILSLLFIAPLLWMVISALKPEAAIFSDVASLRAFIPTGASIQNFIKVFERIPMGMYIYNSLFYALTAVTLGLVVNALAGYALAKFDFFGKNMVLSLIITLIIVPFESILLPLYTVINGMKLTNTWYALVLPFVGDCFSIYLFRQFFLDIPNELLEASYIDGSSKIGTFLKIVIPISGPVFATVFILNFVTRWSDFMWPLLAITNENLKNVQLGIQAFFTFPPIYYSQIMAALTVATLPVVLVFLFFQKYYVQGLTSGSVKG